MRTLAMQTTFRSHIGRRSNNEDAVFGTGRLVAVADGVGGASAGEVASQVVINAMAALEKKRLSRQLEDEFRAAIQHANQTLAFLIACRPALSGMATTLTAVVLSNEATYLVANVGDSRTYLLREGGLRRLTRDQSYVQLLLEAGHGLGTGCCSAPMGCPMLSVTRRSHPSSRSPTETWPRSVWSRQRWHPVLTTTSPSWWPTWFGELIPRGVGWQHYRRHRRRAVDGHPAAACRLPRQ